LKQKQLISKVVIIVIDSISANLYFKSIIDGKFKNMKKLFPPENVVMCFEPEYNPTHSILKKKNR